jgi:hypothetical protein
LLEYTREHLEHEYGTKKACAPLCTVSCVQQVALLDSWRDPQNREAFGKPVGELVPLEAPVRDSN